uniref:Putative nuclear-export-signal nes-containing protein/polyadenylated-rna export factor n=1 Tax=Ixodes ricinus TaxID=34613 RepID=A0A131Y0N3_IXORI
MGETALKFGPEWLRALTQTNGVTAPAPTAGLTKYKLSNYRYGREEMLAMFDQSAPMPETLREFQQLAVENTQPPLALVTMTEEEQRIWARSVNSDAVLRLTVGKGAVPGAGPGRGGPRGGSVDRGRGRGRGGVYQRGLGGSSEESGDTSQFGAFIRARPFERSHSLTERDQRWDDKKPDRQFPARPGFDGDTFRKEGAAAASGGPGGGPGATSATTSRPAENWRSGHSEEDENWRSKVSSAQPPTEKWKSWRNHAKGDEDDGTTAATNGPAKKDRHWIEDHGSVPPEQLPEWIQDQGDTEKVGSFDAKGAFLDTREFEEESWEGDLLPPAQAEARPPAKREDKPTREAALAKRVSEPPAEKPKSPPPQRTHQVPPRKADKSPVRSPPKPIPPSQPQCPLEGPQPKSRPEEASKTVSTSPKDDSFAHLAKAAENMMAEWTAEEEKKFVSQSVAGEQNLPEHLYRWLYKDPQGDIQGPFSSPEMMEWFQAGYFTMDLMVKRVCDMGFSKLGALIKSWGVVPFAASQQPAPMKSPLGAELGGHPPPNLAMPPLPHPGLASLPPNQVTYAFQQHYMQEVYRAAAMQQIQNHLKTNDAFANLSPIDQNRICLQYYMASHPMSRPAGFGDHAPVVNLLSSMGLPPVYGIPHSLAKDSPLPEGPSWPPQPVSTAAPTSTAESRGSSVWDADPSIVAAPLPTAAPSRNLMETLWLEKLASQSLMAEQMRMKEEEGRRLQELQKQARLEEERRLLEERRKEEAEKKRQQEEEEERRRREEEERQRREEEERRRMEEEEERRRRQKEEELLRQQRIEEEKRKVEEERRRMEEERKAEEERKRKAEEAKKAAEEKKRQEKAAKEAAAAAAAAAKAASAMAAAPATGAFTATPAPPAAKKSPSKVSLMDADEFMALKQPPKQQPARVEPVRPDKPQGPVWGSKTSQPVQTSALSLAEIQRMQEEKERSLAEERAQQLRKQQQQAMQQALFLQQQQQQQQKSTLTWASRAQAPPAGTVVKSLSEIQQEEAERVDKMRKAQQQQRQQQQQMRQQESSVLQLSGAWGTTSNSLLKSFNNSFQYLDMVQDEDNTRGFWDEAVTTTPAPKPAPKSTSKPAAGDGSFPSLAGNPVAGASSGRSSKSQQSKKAEEQVMKLFEVHAKAAPTDELTAWCVQVLGGIQSYLDIPTVVAILKDVESPAEVQEYVHNFFGNSLDTKDFVQQFLQRRERYLKSCGSVPRPEDSFTLAASSIASMAAREASATTQGDGFTAARSKKKKKSKMQKVDSSLLGFTVQADPARLNAGEIDRVEGI